MAQDPKLSIRAHFPEFFDGCIRSGMRAVLCTSCGCEFLIRGVEADLCPPCLAIDAELVSVELEQLERARAARGD